MGNGSTEFNTVFEVVCRRLPDAGIHFLLIGGHAVNFYGFSRATLDVDFMIASDDCLRVREIMHSAGFSNVSEQENIIFFNHPDHPLRVDFLRVDQETMATLLSHAEESEYSGCTLLIPALKDLIAMKLFSLKTGNPLREEKDFPDIVHLVLEHGLSVEIELKALCLQYANPAIFEKLKARISELKNA